jgi:hypothetical protein
MTMLSRQGKIAFSLTKKGGGRGLWFSRLRGWLGEIGAKSRFSAENAACIFILVGFAACAGPTFVISRESGPLTSQDFP